MKLPLLTGYAFQAATRTLDLSGVPNFDVRRLLGVFDLTANVDVYLPGEPGFGFTSATGGVIRLQADTTRLADSDVLAVFYDDGTSPLSVNAATADRQDAGNTRLAGILAGLGVLGTDATLQQILTVLKAQRVETIWTDDTGARFIRVDIGGAIVWTDVAGNAAPAPGAGARPDSDSSTVVSRSTYRATAVGTGFAAGDILDHLVVTDGDAGDLVSNFWINVTAGTKVAAPSSASITPLAPLPDGAATAASQSTGNASLASLDGKTPALIAGRQPVDGSGVTQPVSAQALPLPAGAAQDGVDGPGTNPGAGIRGWLSGIYARLGGTLAVAVTAGTAVIGRVGLQVAGSDVTPANPVPIRFGVNAVYTQDASGEIGPNSRFDGPLKAADPRYATFNAAFQADKAAVANIYASVDGGATAGVLVWSKPLAAGEATTAKVPIVFSHFQASITAGAAPTVIQINSGFSVT